MKITPIKKQQEEGAPRQTMIAGEPHMLAYINEAERQMLKRAGGAEAPGPAGIPAYWELFKPSTWGDGKGFQGLGLGSSNKSYEPSGVVPKSTTSGRNLDADMKAGSNYGPTANPGTASATQVLPQTNDKQSNSNTVGQWQSGGTVMKRGNDFYVRYPDGTKSETYDNALDAYNFNKEEERKASNAGRNLDADMFAGSNYAPTINAGTADAFQTTLSNDKTNTVKVDGDTTDFNSVSSITNQQLTDGDYKTIDQPGGGSIIVDNNTPDDDVPLVDIDVDNDDTTGPNTTTTTTDDDDDTTTTAPVDTGPSPAEIAAAARQAALDRAMGRLADAFGFATDDYFTGLGTSYRDGGLSEAFTTAYDDAIRGIYDTYKSAGMLTQSDVDDDLGLLAGAEGGEETRLDNIVNQYVTANRNYVDSGRSSIEDTLRGLGTAAEIDNFDIVGAAAPYKTPKEQEVVDFFSDFVKRAYDPSYNVDPTAVKSGGPKRVSQSVDELGAGTQPSSLSGIFDPVRGGSVKVIK